MGVGTPWSLSKVSCSWSVSLSAVPTLATTAQASATQRAGYAQARVEAVVTGDVDPYE